MEEEGINMSEKKVLLNLRQQIIEKLAELEHKQWAHIINYLLQENMLHLGKYKTFEYRQLAKKPYSSLMEGQKDSDREWAEKAFKVFADGLAVELQKRIEVLEHETPKNSCIYETVNAKEFSLVDVEKAQATVLRDVLACLK
jgi:hypothetical protein